MKTTIALTILSGLLALALSACGADPAGDHYVRYLDKVLVILENQKIEASKKGAEILAFAEKNKADIEKTLAVLKSLSPKQAEGVVGKVRDKTTSVMDAIQSLANTSPEIAEDQSLYKALVLLKVIGK
jgi:hypothetical protein